MEILGLAIVIVLILIATIFIVRFLVFKEATDYRKGFVGTELASNMLSTFLSTNAEDCFQMTMTELLKDCELYGVGGKCVDGDITYGCIQCNNLNKEYSCDFIKTIAVNIFTQTLDRWNLMYKFLAYIDANSPFVIRDTSEGCKEKKSELQPLPVEINTITMFVKLDICQ